MVIKRDIFVNFALGIILLPTIAFSLSFGNFELYRTTQIIVLLALLMVIFAFPSKTRRKPSTVFMILFVTIVTSYFIGSLKVLYSVNGHLSFAIFLKISMFLLFLYAYDKFRNISFSRFASINSYLAFFLVTITFIHFFTSFAVVVNGRNLFFGMQPNLGGEVLFASVVFLSFEERRLLRYLGVALAVFSLFMLQSRGALLATIMVFVGLEVYRFFIHGKANKRAMNAIMILFLAIPIIILILFFLRPDIVYLFMDKVLLVNNSYRGLGTGFVGRTETWEHAINLFSQSPLTGVGFDQSVSEYGDWRDALVHSGYLMMLAEMGILSFALFFLMVHQLVYSFRMDFTRFIVLLSSMFLFAFNARSINLNMFPFIFWLALLPWKITRFEEKIERPVFRPVVVSAAGNVGSTGVKKQS